MAKLRIKRTSSTITSPKLLQGELGLIKDHVYVGYAEGADNETEVTAHPLASLDSANTFTGNNTFRDAAIDNSSTVKFETTNAVSFSTRPQVDGTDVALSTDVPELKTLTINKNGSANVTYDPTDAAKTLNLCTMLIQGVSFEVGKETTVDLGTIDIFNSEQQTSKWNVYSRYATDWQILQAQTTLQTSINAVQTSLDDQVETLKGLITSSTQYLGSVKTLDALRNLEPNSVGDFCRASGDGFTLQPLYSITGDAVDVHPGDMLIYEAPGEQEGSPKKWSVIHGDWKPNSATDDGYVVATGGNTNKGKFWGVDTDGKPQWTNIFQFDNRPTLNGVSDAVKESVKDSAGNSIGDQLAIRGEAVVTGITCKIADEGETDGWDWLVTDGSTISLGASGDEMTITNKAEKTKVVLPYNTVIRNEDGTKEISLENFGGSIKSVKLGVVNDNYQENNICIPDDNGQVPLPFASKSRYGVVKLYADTTASQTPQSITTTADRTYAVQFNSNCEMVVNVPWENTKYTLPVASGSNLGGIKIGYEVSDKDQFAVKLDSNSKAYVEIGTIDCGTWKTTTTA